MQYQLSQDTLIVTGEKAQNKTSVFESLSASLCLMSRAIEKKTSSTFMLVFALCISIISVLKTYQQFWHAQEEQ